MAYWVVACNLTIEFKVNMSIKNSGEVALLGLDAGCVRAGLETDR